MTGSDKIEMTIKIGCERLSLKTTFDRQKDVRAAEKTADALFEEYRRKFPSATDAGVMARVAYRLAAKYMELSQITNEALSLAQKADKQLCDITSVSDSDYKEV